jgi:hypothetical protein
MESSSDVCHINCVSVLIRKVHLVILFVPTRLSARPVFFCLLGSLKISLSFLIHVSSPSHADHFPDGVASKKMEDTLIS